MSGRTVDDQRCFCCGKDNPKGLHLSFSYPAEGRAEAEVRIPEHFSGWQEITHGGFLAMILDEAMAHACLSTGRMGMTAEIEVRFLKPALVGDTVRVAGELAGTGSRLAQARGVITDRAGVEVARATGRFIMAWREDAPQRVGRRVARGRAVRGKEQSMDVYEAIRTRKSVRAYLDKAVEPEKLQRVLEAARLAPSANNRQEWRFVVVTDAALRRRLADEGAGQRFVGDAPVVIAACAETDRHDMRCGIPCYAIDVAIAIDHITLAAAAEGLGTCWIGSFDPQKVRDILGIPPEVEVVELLPMGYPRDPKAVSKSRLSMDTIVHRERW